MRFEKKRDNSEPDRPYPDPIPAHMNSSFSFTANATYTDKASTQSQLLTDKLLVDCGVTYHT